MTDQTDTRDLLYRKIQETANNTDRVNAQVVSGILRDLAEAYALLSDDTEKQIPAKRKTRVIS